MGNNNVVWRRVCIFLGIASFLVASVQMFGIALTRYHLIPLVVICLAFLIANRSEVQDEVDSKEYIDYPWVKSQVDVIYLNQEDDFSEEIADRGLPVIIRNTSIHKWRATQLWTPEYIESKMSHFYNVQKHQDKVFSYFQQGRPMSSLKGVIENYRYTTYQRINLTSSQFFQEMKKTPPYHYYTASAEQLGPLYHDLYPIEPFMVKNSSWKIEESYLHRWTNVWFGPAGATTHTHYDISHNFYAQIYGKKRFVLFSPDQLNNLYLYPFLHPGGQQSQVRFDEWDHKSFPNFAKAEAIEAVLEPGDVLYLPPLWFHHVTALTTSMSVSIWSRYPEVQRMWELEKLPLPFQSHWSPRRLALAGRIFLEILINNVIGEEDASAPAFVENLLEQRYKNLYGDLLFDDKSFCIDHLSSEGDTVDSILNEEQDRFIMAVEERLSLFQQDVHRREIWLGNTAEQLALTVAGVEHTAKFLYDFASC
ncbi:hypothetical protein PROFUN_12292 [Planoprotostelium fungivorum]|uniref:JmjC domain-containing protein n=1 Tax=Planoprotostelium fungivorum TaxID=1890364 RepID=A0A2P6N7S9_9EUKA|nr:hypothetical protein PROFUN_12292 [Planoprotostelium fungivorum]